MELFLPLVTAIIGGLIGGGVAHYFASRRDIAVKRREIILQQMMLALEELEKTNSLRRTVDLKPLEDVVYRLQIVGDIDLVNLMYEFVDEFVKNNHADTTELMIALRDRIRAALALPRLPGKYRYLSVGPFEGKSE